MQRAGRAGRSPNLNARAILLAEKSMFQKRRRRNQSRKEVVEPSQLDDGEEEFDDDNEVEKDAENETEAVYGSTTDLDVVFEWKKQVDEALREWIETEGCRRDVADKYFANPPNRQGMLFFHRRS